MSAETKDHCQKAHYEIIHDAYEAHYYDETSMAYRHRFVYPRTPVVPFADPFFLSGPAIGF
jgi:hypothetical protein